MPIPSTFDPNGRWCGHCSRWAIDCADPSSHGYDWAVPFHHEKPEHRRSVVGTTLLVMFTVFVIAPLILMGGCSALLGLGAIAGQ